MTVSGKTRNFEHTGEDSGAVSVVSWFSGVGVGVLKVVCVGVILASGEGQNAAFAFPFTGRCGGRVLSLVMVRDSVSPTVNEPSICHESDPSPVREV